MVVAATHAGCTEPDRLTVRSKAWRENLELNQFRFAESNASMLYSLSQFRGNCQVHMIYDPTKWWGITFKFMRGDKLLVTAEGSTKSVFRSKGNVLCFAHFNTSDQGCLVTAHNLETGKKLWETSFDPIGPTAHSAYSNEVTMALLSLSGVEGKDEGVVHITGHESYGDYVEILDRETGKELARKVYRGGQQK